MRASCIAPRYHKRDASCNTRVMHLGDQITWVTDSTEDLSTFAGRVKALRNRLGMTQAQFGQKAGVGQSAVSNYERDDRKMPDPDILLSLAEAAGVWPRWLLNGKGPMYIKDGEPPDQQWPFETVSRTRFEVLTERQKGALEYEINAALAKFETASAENQKRDFGNGKAA